LGFAGPDVDVEVIAMCQRLWDDLDLKDLRLQVNSIGDAAERARHRQDLVDYFSRHEQALDADSRRRLQSNPLRILDSKNPAMQSLIEAAPRLLDYLDGASREHFEGVRAGLADLGIPAEVNPR